ncbi:unnamed protein product, partial [Closterium sp. NIES-53]
WLRSASRLRRSYSLIARATSRAPFPSSPSRTTYSAASFRCAPASTRSSYSASAPPTSKNASSAGSICAALSVARTCAAVVTALCSTPVMPVASAIAAGDSPCRPSAPMAGAYSYHSPRRSRTTSSSSSTDPSPSSAARSAGFRNGRYTPPLPEPPPVPPGLDESGWPLRPMRPCPLGKPPPPPPDARARRGGRRCARREAVLARPRGARERCAGLREWRTKCGMSAAASIGVGDRRGAGNAAARMGWEGRVEERERIREGARVGPLSRCFPSPLRFRVLRAGPIPSRAFPRSPSSSLRLSAQTRAATATGRARRAATSTSPSARPATCASAARPNPPPARR